MGFGVEDLGFGFQGSGLRRARLRVSGFGVEYPEFGAEVEGGFRRLVDRHPLLRQPEKFSEKEKRDNASTRARLKESSPDSLRLTSRPSSS